ncbi:PREDICTED: digestive organ expansion factor homolog [Amphimedon queenslandica]|uniref:U3 small nucleolar RNA-associated protein 25 homolog n=1 Tax=Amphimedon queenslandica TaxID=400682 RepID=A0AAN0JC35_AMPQE|nr:PREDICTED: digestive organ expansion factor homolog [Amphimedon queenslandica]XP_019854301.1 PREDICTED: digestive organ expansion factor homolog [Amphimedon queenslandica]|eukprot:XP_011405161.2 PREDICTED: digestive organ expansion factor homolog [Amphimedon queenslandica]
MNSIPPTETYVELSTCDENNYKSNDDDDDDDDDDLSASHLKDDQDHFFSIHYERLLTESDVDNLKDLFSKALTLNKEYKDIGLIQWLRTPSNNKDTIWRDDSSQVQLKDLHVREPLVTLWPTVNKTSVKRPFTDLQDNLFQVMNAYKDLMYTGQTFENESEIRRLYVLHSLNHVIKNRSRVLKNNIRLAMAAKEGRDLGDIRDQGLTRPKVLILVPFRHSALKIVSSMISILVTPGKGEVANRRKFFKLYGEDKESKPPDYKPDSYHQLFSGNIDDCFRIGLSVKKNRLKLFTQFYSSDIIIASPLGLRTIIGSEGEKQRDYDFLSSLEMVIVDQTDIFLMQNWDHLLDVFKHLHLLPFDGHGVDFSRIHEWSLNCWSQYYSQLIMISSFPTPEINSLITSHSRNYEGQVRVHSASWKGSICQILKRVPHVFHNLKCTNHLELPDVRFQYFIETVLPQLSASNINHVCIFIQSYFDFVRVRNFMKREEYSFCHISEYTKSSSVSRSRSFFAQGNKKFLLVTERFHFFRRYHIKGIHHLVFYSLPNYCEFYSELVNQMECVDDNKVLALYSRYDALSIQRIIGTSRAPELISSTEPLHTISFN